MSTRTRRTTMTSAAITILMALSACGGGGDTTSAGAPAPAGDGDAAPTTLATTTTTAPTTTTTVDPGTLPQTEDKPTASGAQWDKDVAGLWDAIVTDDPSKAMSFFFPLSAYQQVKGISDPKHDYDTRLIPYYEDDIHKLHKQLGTNAAKAKLVRIDVGASPQWIKPGVEYNKGAYWRVFDSKIVYEVDGKQSSMLLKSMISWRGQWYVVHLSSVR